MCNLMSDLYKDLLRCHIASLFRSRFEGQVWTSVSIWEVTKRYRERVERTRELSEDMEYLYRMICNIAKEHANSQGIKVEGLNDE